MFENVNGQMDDGRTTDGRRTIAILSRTSIHTHGQAETNMPPLFLNWGHKKGAYLPVNNHILICKLVFAALGFVIHVSLAFYTPPPPPPAKRRYRGCTVFSLSVIPPTICSVTSVSLVRFCSNFHHTLTIRHCMFYRKVRTKGSVLQEICYFVFSIVSCLP